MTRSMINGMVDLPVKVIDGLYVPKQRPDLLVRNMKVVCTLCDPAQVTLQHTEVKGNCIEVTLLSRQQEVKGHCRGRTVEKTAGG